MGFYSDKVIWITGASSGIGKELAFQLSKTGAKLIISARNKAALDKIQTQIQFPQNCLVLPLDLKERDSFEGAVQKVIDHFGRIDILINNAGISQRSYVVETSIEVDKRFMEVNYLGTVALTKLVLPHMLKQGWGHFAIVSSLVGKFGYGVRSAYSASKHALHGFFESLYIELNSSGIGITLICPGPVQTNLSEHALDGSGNPTGEMDVMQEKGMPVAKAASIMIRAIEKGKREIIIGGFKEKLGVILKAFLPSLFFKMASKQNPRGELKL